MVDASPWGIGGVVLTPSGPSAWFADRITDLDTSYLGGTIGDSASLTTWELLAVVVAIRLWRAKSHIALQVSVRSDSLGALKAIAKRASGAPGLSLLLQELALDEAEFATTVANLTHIPGFSNTWADALSRLFAPEPAAVPSALTGVPRTPAPPRGARWYLTSTKWIHRPKARTRHRK